MLKRGAFQSAIIAKLALISSAAPEDRQAPTTFFCDAFKYDNPSDDETRGDLIRLSLNTAKGDPDSQEFTIRHEFAHFFIPHLAHSDPGTVKTLENCLSQQNPDCQSKDELEEDLADLLASTSRTTQNPLCQILSTIDEQRKECSDTSMLSEPRELHSSNLFRILHFEFLKKGSLSQACESYLTEIKYSRKFHNCLNLSRSNAISTTPKSDPQ